MSLRVAIVGRPNVGKSTLFNRLAGRKLALVDDTPGVTRDRRVHAARLYDLTFDIVDTAGLEEAAAASLSGRMRAQTEIAVGEADLIFFMIDAKAGLTPSDRTFAEMVRKAGKPVVLVANKAEARGAQGGMLEGWELGLGEPVAISAEHGRGLADLREAFVAALGEQRSREPDIEPEKIEDALIDEDVGDLDDDTVPAYDASKPMRIAVVGRPNAGKSTLINALIGQERLLSGPEAGITRDSIAVDWQWRGRGIRLFDTAGMRRKARIQEKLEKLSVADGLRAVRFAEVVVVLLDATIPFEKQDLQIADLIVREGRALVIAFNKWDMIDAPQQALADLREKTDRLLPQIRGVQALPVSAETGRGLDKLMDAVLRTHEVWNRRISTGRLNRWLEAVLAHHPPPAVAGRRLKIKYVTQAKTRPPGFVLSCTRPDAMPASYLRYLANSLREAFDMPGTPIRMMLRAPANPYGDKASKR